MRDQTSEAQRRWSGASWMEQRRVSSASAACAPERPPAAAALRMSRRLSPEGAASTPGSGGELPSRWASSAVSIASGGTSIFPSTSTSRSASSGVTPVSQRTIVWRETPASAARRSSLTPFEMRKKCSTAPSGVGMVLATPI